MENSTRFGRRLKRLRRERRITALRLAHEVGLTENAIRKLEAGASKEPRFSTGLRIASALGVSPSYLAGLPKDGKKPTVPQLQNVLQTIREHRKELEQLGVTHAYVFGSVARGKATSHSDIDVAIDYGPNFNLIDLVRVKEALIKLLGRKVDVASAHPTTPSALSRIIAKEAANAF